MMTKKMTFEGPNLADAIASLRACVGSLGEDGKVLASQLERAARILQRDPVELPADPRQIDLITDAEIGDGWRAFDFPSEGAWRTFRSRLRAGINGAFKTTRVDPLRVRGRGALTPEWRTLMAELDAGVAAGEVSKWTLFTLVGLSRFASAAGVAPDAVDSGLFLAWIADAEAAAKAAGKVVRGSCVRGPGRHAYDAARAWNKLVEGGAVPGGLVEVSGLKTSRKWNAPISAFHPELRNEISCYLEWLRGGVVGAAAAVEADEDSFDGYASGQYEHVRMPEQNTAEGNGPKARVTAAKDGTVARYTHLVRFAVNAVAEKRKVPVETIRSLADVVNADGISKYLAVYIQRQKERGKWDARCGSLHGIAAWGLGVAKSWCRLDEMQTTRIRAILKDPRVRTESVGRMSAQRRDTLKNVHHEWFVRSWVNLPAELVGECRISGGYKIDERSRATMRAAVVLAIGQILPLRLENLSTLTVTGHRPTLVRPRIKGGLWSIDIPAAEVKNENGAYGVLDARTSRIIDAYVEHIRPADLAAAEGESDCLFPGTSKSDHRSQHIGLKSIGAGVSGRLQKAGLGHLTTHCIRHVTATLLLAWNPSLHQTVADLLGDTVETVEKHYIRGNVAAAVKMNLGMIQAHLAEVGKTLNGFGKKGKRHAA